LRDEIRMLEQEDLGIPAAHTQSKAPVMGRSNEGKPGTRKMRFGKEARKWKGR
jgi:excinuclease ABC subunit B